MNQRIISVQVAEADLSKELVASIRFLNAVDHCKYHHFTAAFLNEVIAPAAKMASVDMEIDGADLEAWRIDGETAAMVCLGIKELVMYSALSSMEKIEKVIDLIQLLWCGAFAFSDDFEKVSVGERRSLVRRWDLETNVWVKYLQAQFILDGFVDRSDLIEMGMWCQRQYERWFGKSSR